MISKKPTIIKMDTFWKRPFITVILIVISVFFNASLAKSVPNSENTSVSHEESSEPEHKINPYTNCDCNDPEALFHKALRKIINEEGKERMRDILEDLRPRKVCGSDGKFYDIECQLLCTKSTNSDKADLHEKKPGYCRRRNTNNPRFLNTFKKVERKSHKLRHNYEHQHKPQVCICPRHYAPICASNGITYGNHCTFECAKRYQHPEIFIVSKLKCHESDQTALIY